MSLTLRTQKGASLTYSELDNNFSYLVGLTSTNTGQSASYSINSAKYNPPTTSIGDWSAAIQAAVDDCAASGGGIVQVPAGTFKTTKSINMPSFVTIKGVSKYVSKIVIDSAIESVITVPVASEKWAIRDLSLSNSVAYPDRNIGGSQFGIYVCGQYGVVSDCEVFSVVAGIVLNGARDCVISNNFVHDTTADGIPMFGADFGPNKRNLIICNRVENTGDDGIAEVWYLNYTDFPNEDNTIIGNTLTNILATGISLWGGIRTTVCSNKITNTLNCGIRTNAAVNIGFGNVSSVNIYGNTITNAGKSPARRESGNASVTEKCAGIMVQTWSNSGLLTDIKIHNNLIVAPAGSYIAALNRESNTTITNLSITENMCIGGNATVNVSAGKEYSGVGHGIWINNVKNLNLRGNTVDKAFGNGICIDNANIGIANVSNNTVTDCNQGNINPAAAISVNSAGSLIGIGNAILDEYNRLVNGIYISNSVSESLLTDANNLLGGRVLSSSTAGGIIVLPPTSGTYFTEEFTKLNSSGTFEGWSVGYQGEGAPYTYGTLETVNGSARLTPLANVNGLDYITLLTNSAFDLKDNIVSTKLKVLPTDNSIDISFILFSSAYNRTRISVSPTVSGIEIVNGPSSYYYPIDGQNVAATRFIAFRESAGTLYLLTSTDGGTWNTIYSFPNPYSSSSFRFGLQVGYYNKSIDNPSHQDFEYVKYAKY
jgi:hypothetical protein